MYAPRPSKILIVDDTESTCYAISRVLRNEGYEVATAATGREALERVQDFFPDLITLDIHLPDISGYEVCRLIKTNPETSHIAILQMSASYISNKDKIQGLDGGADSYLTHPIDSSVLTSTIKALLRMRSMSESLRGSEEMLRLAVETTQIGTWDYNPGTHALSWSEQCKEIFGLSKEEEVTYEKYLSRLHPEDIEQQLSMIEDLKSGKIQEINHEHRVVHADGTVRWVHGRGSVHRTTDNDGQKIRRIIGTVLDITERRLAMQELVFAKNASENANRAKTQFLANMSHEIRTPLGAILGFTDLITESGEVQGENSHFLGIIKRNAHQLSKLIDEILDLSKVEADKMEIEEIRFDFLEVIEDVLSLMKMKAAEKGLELNVNMKGEIPRFIENDPTRLRQIIINLLTNAVKFTHQGGVEIRISTTQKLQVYQEMTVVVEVIDTGIGMTEEQVGKLFQPFVQADGSMTRKYGGTGLGLSLSRRLAQILGGKLTLAESRAGKGSTFRLEMKGGKFDGTFAYVPSENGGAESEKAAVFSQSIFKDKKILVVEDAQDNQLILKRILSLFGAKVQLANNGSEGVEKILGENFDIVLMDIQMPLLDGYQAVQQLRLKNVVTPIIALTAHALKGERERCLDAGFSDYLTKPIDRKNLLDKISQYIV